MVDLVLGSVRFRWSMPRRRSMTVPGGGVPSVLVLRSFWRRLFVELFVDLLLGMDGSSWVD